MYITTRRFGKQLLSDHNFQLPSFPALQLEGRVLGGGRGGHRLLQPRAREALAVPEGRSSISLQGNSLTEMINVKCDIKNKKQMFIHSFIHSFMAVLLSVNKVSCLLVTGELAVA